MRAGVADYHPVIIAYHMRSHPEAVSHCDRPFATHPPPLRTARPAQDFWWGDELFGDEDARRRLRSSVRRTRAHTGSAPQQCQWQDWARTARHIAPPQKSGHIRTSEVNNFDYPVVSWRTKDATSQ